ncbi:hypothetical protein ABEP23_29230 [Paenibacillus illinoisensis]
MASILVPSTKQCSSDTYFFVNQKLKHGSEYGFKNTFHALGTEAIQGAEVGALPCVLVETQRQESTSLAEKAIHNYYAAGWFEGILTNLKVQAE